MQRNRAVHGHNECKYYYHSEFHNDSCTHNRPDDNDDFRTYDNLHDYRSTDADDSVLRSTTRDRRHDDFRTYDNLHDHCSTNDHDDFRTYDSPHDYCSTDDNDDVCYDNLINDFRPRPLFHNGICIRQGRHHLPFRDLIPELRSQ